MDKFKSYLPSESETVIEHPLGRKPRFQYLLISLPLGICLEQRIGTTLILD